MKTKATQSFWGFLGAFLLLTLLMLGNGSPVLAEDAPPNATPIPTLTLTLIPTFTPSPTPQPSPTPANAVSAPQLPASTAVTCTLDITTTDAAPFGNHTITDAATIANYTGQSLLSHNGVPHEGITTQVDFYRLDNAHPQYHYTIQAVPDRTTNYNLGIIVYGPDRRPIYTDTDTSDYRASITFEATGVGPYYFKVFQVSSQCSGGTYTLIYNTPVAPTNTPSPTPTHVPPTATPVPQPTWPSGFDQYEPNYDFDHATTIASGLTYNLNFVPWGGWKTDNDFFKIRVKPGLQLTCQTSDLDPGVDPNMIFFTGPSWDNAVASNDDIKLGDFNSRVSFYSNYEGFMYVLVGQGDRMDVHDTVNSKYKLRCDLTVPGTVTPVPGSGGVPDKGTIPTPRPTPTPRPPASPIATPTPAAVSTDLTFHLLKTPTPIVPTPTPGGFRNFRIIVYYDVNQDGELGAGEGVPGFFVQVLSAESGEELARGYTDEQGQLSFTVPTIGTVQVVVPLLGFDRLVESQVPEVIVRIVPPPMPSEIP